MRVRQEVHLPPAAIRDVRIALGRSQVGVSEHLLHRAEIGATLEQMCGERVAQKVGVNASRLEAGPLCQAAQDEKGAGTSERAAAGVQEELGSVPAVEMGPTEREVTPGGLGSRTTEWDETLLAALSVHPHDPLLDVHSVLLEAHGLRDPQARAIQELDERAVAEGARRGSGRCVDEPLGLCRRQSSREPSSATG